MAKLKRRKRKKMTITQRYNRIAVGIQYFGITLNEKKRATRKALKEAQRIYKQARKEAKAGGVTELPSISQLEKYVRESQHEVEIPPIDEREELPYAPVDEIPYFDENESIIETFLTEMQTALSELMLLYGMSTPWRAKEVEEQILDMMSKFNEARNIKGDEYVAQYLSNNLDFARIHDMVYSDSEGRAEAIDDVSSIIDGILDGM
ncbi:MAG: hypothetical protein J6F30_08870 [Cellulosilyticum sp.]|nr:hypothetical protein [Cellulosilyticum sp.]